MLHHNAFVNPIYSTLYLPKITEQDYGTYLCTVESLVREDCVVTVSITSLQTISYGHEAMAAAVPTMVVVIIASITLICFCRREKQSEELAMKHWKMNSPP